MATTMATGVVTTAGPTSNQLKIDMREKIAMLDVDNTQFTTISMKLGREKATSFKIEWLEDEYNPTLSALAVSAASDLVALTLTTDEGNYFRVGHIIINAITREVMRVTTTAASSVTVTRAIGSVAAASAASGGEIVIVGTSNQQGATSPAKLITKTAAKYNYTEIGRNSWGFTETALATEWYGGDLGERERMKQAISHKWDIENTLFFGGRSYNATGPETTCGGLLEFVTSNITDAGGTFDKGELQDFLRTGLQRGSKNKVLFAAPIVAQVLGEFLQDNWVRATPSERIFGVKVDAVISAIYGGEIPVFVKRDWGRYATGSTQFGGYAFLVDLDNVQFKPLRPTTLKMNTQANDADSVAGEWKSEYSLAIEIEKSHAILRGVTG